MYSLSTTSKADIFRPYRVIHPQPSINLRNSHPISFPFRFHFARSSRKNPPFIHRLYAVNKNSDSSAPSSQSDGATSTITEDTEDDTEDTEEDFVSRVLSRNPSRVEPKYLVDDKLYTLQEKEYLEMSSFDEAVAEILKKLRLMVAKEKNKFRLMVEKEEEEEKKKEKMEKKKMKEIMEKKKKEEIMERKKVIMEKKKEKEKMEKKKEEKEKMEKKKKEKEKMEKKKERRVRPEGEVVSLKDILREHRGKLYVPENIFRAKLSEEEEFDWDFKSLPQFGLEDFRKYMENDKIKFLTLKEDEHYGSTDFIVELKEVEEIPDDETAQITKWTMKLDESEAQAILEEYTGPRYEIEKQTMSWVGKLPEYPHPVASSISSRIMVELGMLTAAMAAAALLVGGYLALAVFAVTRFVFAVAVHDVWPMARSFLNLFRGLMTLMSLIPHILERVWNVVDISRGRLIFSKLSEFYDSVGSRTANARIVLVTLVPLAMVFLCRFALARRPRNFKKWSIWQGIEFSQSKPQARVDGSTGVTFNDVAGIEEAVEELQELVRYLKNPELFDKMGIKPPHGILLEGPPGCGKTLVAKAIAGEAGVPFYQMAGSEFVEVLVGVGSARIRDLFKRAKANRPSVIFVDEIDALGTRRQGIYRKDTNHRYNAATQERETTLNQLLIELDGFDTGKGVIFLGATNRRDLLDPALLRPGRFDRKIRICSPNAKGRLGILKVHARKVKLSDSVDLSIYARNLPGWTGAKLAQLLQEAALVAVRKGHNSILQSDVDDAVDRLTVGPKRVGIELGHQGQCRRATTKVGTAMTAHLLRQLENAKVERCDCISINPRGQTLSQLVFHRLDDESYMFERRPQLLHRLQVLLGGRAAEEVIFGRDTSVASVPYLADASWLARKIITIWNLENPMVIRGEKPAWRKRVKFLGPKLDFEGSLYHTYGLTEPPLNVNMEDEVARRTEELMHDMYGRTTALLRRHHAALLKTVKVLLNQKEISGEEIDFILNSYPPHTPASCILEEKDPGSLPFFTQEEEEGGGGPELEYSMLTP